MDSRNSAKRFEDSEFDWDSLRLPLPKAEKPQSETTRLAWVVLILLAFCPLVGFLLASLWGG